MEAGESPEEAARRELREEALLEVGPLSLLGVYTPIESALVVFAWALTTGQNFPGSINYAPLGKSLQEKSLAQLGKITLDGKPLITVPST